MVIPVHVMTIIKSYSDRDGYGRDRDYSDHPSGGSTEIHMRVMVTHECSPTRNCHLMVEVVGKMITAAHVTDMVEQYCVTKQP